MARSRSMPGWVPVLIGLAAVGIAGVWLFAGGKKRVLHPDPRAIPAAITEQPTAKWSAAVARARGIVQSQMAGQNLAGLSVAVGAGGGMVWSEGFGWAHIEPRTPVTPQTRFRIGTASTGLTGAAAGMLLESGKLSLDEEIQTYVPQFPKKQWPLTVRQMMAQIGGLATDAADDDPLFRQRCEQPVQALPHFAAAPLLFEPGTQYRPSNYGWILASAAVEGAGQQPFATFVRERILQPLQMGDTGVESAAKENPERIGEPEEDPPIATFIRHTILTPLGMVDAPPKPREDPATLYVPGAGPGLDVRYRLHWMRIGNLSCYAGSMAYFSTPADLVRFGLALHSGQLLKPATVQLLQTSQRLNSGKETGYGLGWSLHAKAAGQDGELHGRTVAAFRIFRETGIVVAVMSNTASAAIPELALKVGEAFE